MEQLSGSFQIFATAARARVHITRCVCLLPEGAAGSNSTCVFSHDAAQIHTATHGSLSARVRLLPQLELFFDLVSLFILFF